MKKGLVLVMVLALLALAVTANAEPFGKGKFQFSAGLRQLTVYTVDTAFTIPVYPGAGVLGGFNATSVVGIGGDFKYGLSDAWALNWGGYFAFGSDTWEYDVDEVKWKTSAYGLYAGVDRTINLNQMVGLYFGPGLEWTSAKLKNEDDNYFGSEWENPRTSAFSLQGKIGAQAMLGSHFGINANLGQKWSRVSFSDELGGFDLKLSGWRTSMDGFAGFTIYVN